MGATGLENQKYQHDKPLASSSNNITAKRPENNNMKGWVTSFYHSGGILILNSNKKPKIEESQSYTAKYWSKIMIMDVKCAPFCTFLERLSVFHEIFVNRNAIESNAVGKFHFFRFLEHKNY